MPAWDMGAGPMQYDPSKWKTTAPDQTQNLFQQGLQTRLTGQDQYQHQLGLGQQGFGFNSALLQQELASRGQLAGLQAQTQREGYASQERQAQTQADAAKFPAQLAQQRFNTAFPLVQNTLSSALNGQGSMPAWLGGGTQGAGGMGGAGGAGGAGGGQQPLISARPVYTPGDVQQQVNLQRSSNDQATAGKMRQMDNSLAGRGFGTGSPLAQALGVGMQQGNLATNTQNETQTRMSAKQMNAGQVLQGQQAQEAQFANRQKEALGRAGVYQNYLSSALAAVAGMI